MNQTDLLRAFIFKTLLPFEAGRPQRLHVEEILSRGYDEQQMSAADRRFGTFLAYGVLRHWFLLSQMIQAQSRIPLNKLASDVRLLLRMGLFQLAFMESVPDFAAVSSTLELASAFRLSAKSRGFINAVLRAFIRQGKPVPQGIEQRLPSWCWQRLISQYGEETARQIAMAFSAIPSLSIRINTLKLSLAEYQAHLTAAQIPFEAVTDLPEVLRVTAPQGDPRQLPGFHEGWFLVQDPASARVSRFLNPLPGEIVLEIGAAPGTKTTHMAALMANQGRIIAVDSSVSRLEKLRENTQRLGVHIAEPLVADGQTVDCTGLQPDRVLIDAPCSGTGTIGKHPEILLALKERDFARYAKIQRTLLEHGFSCLKPGGTLVYSTCSIDRTENQDVIAEFLNNHTSEAHLEEACQLLPTAEHDGFYMARIKKRNC